MKHIQWLLTISLACLFLTVGVVAQPYKDAAQPIDTRVKDLLSRMTPEEKFWQLFMPAALPNDSVEMFSQGAFGIQVGRSRDIRNTAESINRIQRHFVEHTRLGIPIIVFEEALHGLIQKGATVYPQAIALAATFDTSLMHDVSAAVADDCRSRGIRQVLSPVVNIATDVRWGRVEETYGEDPLLASAMGVAFVSEFEQRGIITTPKHFIANVGDGGRDSYPIHINERLLREIYLPPFEACIRRGGSRSVMTAYNSLDGSPCSANDWLNSKWLKQDLGFTGFVISDAGAVGGANVLHFTAGDYPESGQRALMGGLDVIFQTSYDHYSLFIQPFLDGRIPADVIDRAVERVLRAKFELGLFEHPYVEIPKNDVSEKLASDRSLARRAAQESFVLLKNDHQALPLSANIKSLAVIGPNAQEINLGGYSGAGNDRVSILDGIRKRAGKNISVQSAKGCSRLDTDYVTIPSSYLSCAYQDSVRDGLVGTYFDNIELTGSPVLTRVDPQIQFQWTLFSPDVAKLPFDCYSARWTGRLKGPITGPLRIGIEGNDGYRLYLNDSLVLDNWRTVSYHTRVVKYPFVKDHQYNIRLEYAEPSGTSRLRLIWDMKGPHDADSLLSAAVAVATSCDAAIVVVGLEEGEFRDRASLCLPGRQEELIRRVAATGRPTTVILVGGSAVTMNRWIDSVAAVLDVWYPGEAGGDAVADVLFGDVSPAGRLPITFPLAEGQLPLVYNHKPTGRGDDYTDLSGLPLFPFGYGLSYSEFTYSNLSVSPPRIASGDSAIITCQVKNSGPCAADEVVQLYVRDVLASVARPVTELKSFQRVHLLPGQAKMLSFRVGPDELSMLDEKLERVIEPGDFRIMIGASSRDIRLHGTLQVTRR